MSLFQNMKSKLLPIAAVSVLTAGVFAGAELQQTEKYQRQKTRQS
nr:hypothetical protein P5658_23040 [Bacillus subtilis]